jgi:hypothetical protein
VINVDQWPGGGCRKTARSDYMYDTVADYSLDVRDDDIYLQTFCMP